jgi:hypothetical protein
MSLDTSFKKKSAKLKLLCITPRIQTRSLTDVIFFAVYCFLLLISSISQINADSLVRVDYDKNPSDLQKVLMSGFRTILHRPGLFIDVVVPQKRSQWISSLSSTRILHQNFDQYIKAISSTKDFGSYHTEQEIEDQLTQWEAQYPHLVQKSIIGYGWNDKNSRGPSPINLITLGSPSENKPALLLFAGIHSREISSTEILLRIVDRILAESRDQDSPNRAALDAVTVYVIPCLNPDGRKLVFDGNIWWRKNCRPGKGTAITGVDINRNFPFHFGPNNPYGGSSNSLESETYRGPTPFSEPEAKALRDLVINHPEIVASASFHSYGGFILVPNGFNGLWPEKHESLYREVTDFITGNENWPIGTVKDLLGYYSNGRHDDWLYGSKSALKKQILAIQLEIGESFFPEAHKLKPLTDRVFPLIKRFMDRISMTPSVTVKKTTTINSATGALNDSKDTLLFSIENNQLKPLNNLTVRISINNKIFKPYKISSLGGLLRGNKPVASVHSINVDKNLIKGNTLCNVRLKWSGGSCNIPLKLPDGNTKTFVE